jgi:large subunit ribosomal protein L28e
MSHSLVWEVLKSNNAFVVKNNGVTFSREPGNLLNVNRKRFSGLANARAIDIRPTRNTKTVSYFSTHFSYFSSSRFLLV